MTGHIGEAFLGLTLLTTEPDVLGARPEDRRDDAIQRYRVPEPPLQFAPTIAAHARASIDVSDGLIGDAAKLAAASNVAIRIDAEAVPLTSGGEAFVQKHGPAGLIQLLTGGDDYQALFTAPPEARAAILEAGRATGTNVVLIGDVLAGAGVRVVSNGVELAIPSAGHAHKLGA